MSNARSVRIKTAIIWLVLFLIMLVTIFPVAWVLLTSIKPGALTFVLPPVWRFTPTLENYRHLFFESRFALGIDMMHNLTNSVIVATVSTVLAMVAALYAGYGLSRFAFRGKGLITIVIMATRMLPPIGTIIPFFLLIHSLQLIDSHFALILAYMALNVPLATWMLRGFIDEVPMELDDAAIIDGCNRNRTLWNIITPLCAPGLVATAVFSFVLSWNEFPLASVLTKKTARTLPLVVSSFITEEGIYWGPMSAAAIIVFIPPILLFLFTYRHLARGLTMGAVKG